MSEVKMIIEVDYKLSKEDQERLIDLIKNELYLSEKYIRIYESKIYYKQSEYSSQIYAQIRDELASEYI